MNCSVMTDAYDTITGCLPHTGLDVWPIFFIGVVLLVSGLVCYWVFRLISRPKKRPSGWPPVRHD